MIRSAEASDRDVILDIHRRAFGKEDEATLVANLLDDPTAAPSISLLAESEDGTSIGHVLFTSAGVDGQAPDAPVMLLAPLAVVPEAQRIGVGTALVRAGIELARDRGVGAIFVLGHPGYYPRHGFSPAGVLGLHAPYPIPEKDAAAWMALETTEGALGESKGRVVVADALMKPEYWRE